MAIDSLKELEQAQAKVAEIRSRIVQELASLPEKYGFSSMKEFFKAIEDASGSVAGGQKRKVKRAGRKPAAPKAAKKSRGGRGGRISDDVRAKVKELVEAGESGAKIAKRLGISLPSVQNIKKGFGLVKSGKGRKAKVVAIPAVETAPQAPAPATPAS